MPSDLHPGRDPAARGRRKLIELRLRSELTRRCTILRLTDKGKALALDAVVQARAITEATLAPLTSTERQAFLALLRKLI